MLLITGSSGYLGRSFIKYYQKNYEIRTFSKQNDSIESIDFKNVKTILHCAALVHQKTEQPNEKYLDINVRYPVELAKKAKDNGVKQFIFISTIAVYGEEYSLLDESLSCRPITFYGKSKLEAEKELLKLESDDFILTIIRPPMIYGENAPGNIDSLIKIVRKTPLLPFAKIFNKRSFIYIENLCYLINETIVKDEKGIFLACDDQSVSLTRLIKLIALGLNKKIFLIKVPFFESLLKLLKPSIHKKLYTNLEINNTKTREKLNLKNPYSIEEGIKFMIQRELK